MSLVKKRLFSFKILVISLLVRNKYTFVLCLTSLVKYTCPPNHYNMVVKQPLWLYLCQLMLLFSFSSDTYLSFESSYYMFPETSVGAGIYFIHIIKNRQSSTTETENTYELIVQVKSVDKAEKDKDFSAISISQIIFANEVKIAYVFIIFNDIIPEENESFIIKISPVANKLQWVNGRSVTTNITIIDDDGKEHTE